MLGSGIGRNALGNTNALIAAFTGDRSDSKCGLNPGPIQSMPMMIWVGRRGGGGVLRGVSVLWGAGGGLTVHPANTIHASATNAPTVTQTRRTGLGTPIRLSSTPTSVTRLRKAGLDFAVALRSRGQRAKLLATRLGARPAASPGGGGQLDFADPHDLRGHLDAFVGRT